MDFYEVLDQVIALLQKRGRASYSALKFQFQLDEQGLGALKDELLYSHPEVVEDGGRGLIWQEGRGGVVGRSGLSASPVSYTPPYLAERILAEQAAMEARGATEGERKTITALFADIKGSMALMEDLDPEEARAIIDPVLALMMEAVHRYEGYVA